MRLFLLFSLVWFYSSSLLSIKSTYLLDNSVFAGRKRLSCLEKLENPQTFAFLASLPIKKGWHCLDVGSGLGGVATWLASQVGEQGMVVATDIDVVYLKEVANKNLTVVTHNIITDPLLGKYDLIHMRNVLMHLPDKEAIVKKLVSALKIGGFLVIDDMGILNYQDRFSSLQASSAVIKFEGSSYDNLENNGYISFHSAFHNHEFFRKYGLIDVQAKLTGSLVQGGDTPAGCFMSLSTRQLEKQQIKKSTDAILYTELLKAYQDKNSNWWDHLQVITVGKKIQ